MQQIDLQKTYILNIAYLPVHYASLYVDNPRDSAAIPVVLALIEPKFVLDFLFGTENVGFCTLMKFFSPCISRATELKKDKIRMLNVKFAGKRKSLNHFDNQKSILTKSKRYR